MATESLIDRQFTDAYNQIHELYDNDELDECIEQAQQLLQDPAIPRYHRMKTYILLVSTIGEWTEANGYRSQAETLWRIVRRWHPEGEDAKVDAAMQELRTALDALKNELEVEQPEDYDPEEDVEAELAAHDERVAEEVALAEAENDDPVELAKADKVAVAAMSSKMDEMEIDTKKPKKVCLLQGETLSYRS